jgi:hypothetical protein
LINLAQVDCFTLLDYVEAMRRSRTFAEFIGNTREVRYRSGVIGYAARNHFFTDWIGQNASYVADLTADVGCDSVRTVKKRLNKKDDGTAFVAGISPVERDISYLPIDAFSDKLGRLQTGDYLGIYSPFPGLDVSHTGIVIENHGDYRLRHASSHERVRQVVDQDLMAYLSNKPGIIILRPL